MACDNSLDGVESGSDPSGPDTGITGSGSGSTDPVVPSDPSGLEPSTGRPAGVVNDCGGTGTLRWNGAPADLLDPCGVVGEGILVCGGLDVLRCTGDTAVVNACGFVGPLPVEPGEPCGLCGDGVWVCGPSEALVCIGASSPNVCGGCAPLEQRPGSPCDAEEGGRWVCSDSETLACVSGAANACGGQDALAHDGVEALPGDACDRTCGGGVLRCDGAETLACVEDGTSPPENACGGCGTLAATPDTACGACGEGPSRLHRRWRARVRGRSR
ncbi:MAG: hypothetical protein EA398_15075 [Deltaproteobacteria bacterium]|nr:MAG: hypothetical protein EA398_15075 [Deltaproteobacteria bacterium]